uniref:Uncharacterized protein n=1 Tax=Acrobeloides nanus TaxID=290746 RepID=A0A914DEB4_9BILA
MKAFMVDIFQEACNNNRRPDSKLIYKQMKKARKVGTGRPRFSQTEILEPDQITYYMSKLAKNSRSQETPCMIKPVEEVGEDETDIIASTSQLDPIFPDTLDIDFEAFGL